MPRFYEQRIDGRTIISSEIIPGARIVDGVSAKCWLDAKRQLCYPLSDKDDDKLDAYLAERKKRRKKI